MNVETFDDWHSWFSDLGLSKDTIQKYADAFVDASMTEVELAELNHETLKELDVTLRDSVKIMKKVNAEKAGRSTSSLMVVKAEANPTSVNQQRTGNVNDVTSDTTNEGAGNGSTSSPTVVKPDAIPTKVNQQNSARGLNVAGNMDGSTININNQNPASSSGTGNVNDVKYDTTNEGGEGAGDTENLNAPTFNSNNSTTTVNNTNKATFKTNNKGGTGGGKTSNINKPTFG